MNVTRFVNMQGLTTHIHSSVMKAEVYSVTYRIPLTNVQQARLDRKWPDGTPFITYEKIDSLLEPLVEDVYWSTQVGHYYFSPFVGMI
jgi:hypothetical protein